MKLDTTQHKIIHMGAPERSEKDPVGYIMKKKKNPVCYNTFTTLLLY